jgi:hypothetical protein
MTVKRTLTRGLRVACLFVFLRIVLGGALHLNTGAALLAAATGTPLLIAGARRLQGCLSPPRAVVQLRPTEQLGARRRDTKEVEP